MIRKPKRPPIVANVPQWAQGEPIISGNALHAGSTRSIAALRTQPLCRVDEAAAVLQVSTKTVRRLIGRGDLNAVRIGRSVRIHFSELENLIASGGANASVSGGGGDHV